MDIKETFLKLTNHTYPYGKEFYLEKFLPKGFKKDKYGNYYYKIGKSKTIFACHLDTACKKYEKVNHVIDGKMIKTNGKTILGADDKAGMVVLLYMIEQNIPGTYYFFVGEEVGCIGSKAASAKDNFSNYNSIISFDRRDTCSIITHQSWERCCSDDFANALSNAYIDLGLELKPDDGGVYTDSAEFTDVISECTNISVGYYKEHTHEESQDIDFLEKLCMASAIIDWENLPIVRDFKVKEYKTYNYYNHNYNNYNNQRDRKNVKRWNNNRDYDYGYNDREVIDYEEPFDRAVYEDLKNKRGKERKKNKEKIKNFSKIDYSANDMFLTYKDLLTNKFTVEEYKIIEEQYLNLIP